MSEGRRRNLGPRRTLPYAQQTFDSANPLVRFAHRSRMAASLRLAGELLPGGGTIVDFGAGDGAFLKHLKQRRPDAQCLAVEPQMVTEASEIAFHQDLAELPRQSVHLLTALEVLEHLHEIELHFFVENARRLLVPGGRLLVTVPVMYGLTLPAKELSRAVKRLRFDSISLAELVKATLGRPIPRSANIRGSHTGFDFRNLRKLLAAQFAIERQSFLPFPALPWWCNSQALFLLELPS